ncbi:MAG: class I SAM-dependent methyltransferase [Candidatus Woesearchaeota archaeon]|nr:class I SAM-dependent methyltransferase [Candidatus Woesearchaeota archaeon]
MEYLKYNLQRKRNSFFRNLIIKIICRKRKVYSHYTLYLAHFIDLLKLKDKKISVCEIGGADGWAISYTNKNVTNKTMIDCDNTYGNLLEKQGINFIHTKLGDGKTEINKKFDLVILNHVMEHIIDYDAAVNELYQIIKPNGFVIIRCPNILVNKFSFWNDFTHVKPYTPHSLESLFKSNDFTTIILQKFSYDFFTLGYLFNKKVQNWLSSLNGDEILYVGQKR